MDGSQGMTHWEFVFGAFGVHADIFSHLFESLLCKVAERDDIVFVG